MGDLEEKARCADAFEDELTVLQVSELFFRFNRTVLMS